MINDETIKQYFNYRKEATEKGIYEDKLTREEFYSLTDDERKTVLREVELHEGIMCEAREYDGSVVEFQTLDDSNYKPFESEITNKIKGK